jgi:alkylation response protein AidB-like acyl-CoA dehydrogenase
LASLSADERAALRDSVHRLLADRSSEAHVRATMETEAGYDAALWTQLSEMGVAGLVIDEAHGGAGAGPLELEAVMEEAGAALLCSPLVASSVLAAELLRALGDKEANSRLLPGIAAGTTIATAALTGEAGTWTEDGVTVSASADGRLNGLASYVLHGQNADVLLVVADGPDGLQVLDVDPKAAGVTVTALPTFDHTLRLAKVVFDNAPGRALAAAGSVWEAVRQALDLALVALAGEQAGGARRTLEFTVDYAKARIQFGRAIGSFQAVKHMCADALVDVESARSAAYYAAWAAADHSLELATVAPLARAFCSDTLLETAATNIQVHGGIAFTWEHPAHLYYRRAKSGAQLWGDSRAHRDVLATQIGL